MGKMKVTEDRSDDAKGAADPHMAKLPTLSMAQQREKMRDGEIWGFHCNACKYDQVSPMMRCRRCGSSDIATRKFSTSGTVVSYTIQTVAPEQFMNEVPYAFAVIQLDDGPKVSGWVPWISRPDELPMGSSVEYTPTYKPGMMFEKA